MKITSNEDLPASGNITASTRNLCNSRNQQKESRLPFEQHDSFESKIYIPMRLEDFKPAPLFPEDKKESKAVSSISSEEMRNFLAENRPRIEKFKPAPLFSENYIKPTFEQPDFFESKNYKPMKLEDFEPAPLFPENWREIKVNPSISSEEMTKFLAENKPRIEEFNPASPFPEEERRPPLNQPDFFQPKKV